ncbi:hypothetical protein ACFS07_10040 [Undibacterium arcticum]
MPHLKGRPVAWLRAPDGITKQLFFSEASGSWADGGCGTAFSQS